jgi:4-amino-4-deoxy-L-arabinose transferase-like glycosyltransferase
MTPDLTRPAHQRALLVLLGVLLFFWGLGDRDLNSSHEARAAQNAQSALSDGHWLLPRLFDGQLELQKPPLYYWLVALAGLAGGQVGAWAVRLPAALSALGCLLFIHLIGCRRGRPLAGFLAALTLATSLHFTWLARVGRIDMPLTFAVTVGLGSFYLGRSGGRRWFALGYTALGFGVLLKGPIALVLPAVVWVACGWPLATLGWGLPLMLLIAAPWYVWANAESGGRLWDVFFWYHNVERGLGSSETLKAHPWWFYGRCCLTDLFPWALALPLLARHGLRRGFRNDPEACVGLRWFVAMLLFLSVMSFKRADYLLPAYPGFALLLGCVAERAWTARRSLAWVFGLTVAGCALGWTAYNGWVVPEQEGGWPYRRVAQTIRAQTDRPVIFFRAESHVLAFNLGRPVDTIREWENLQWWTERPFPVYIVMPEDAAREWPEHLRTDALEEVLRTRDWIPDGRDHPLVVLRARGREPAP